jgi:hypothetical protein
MRYMPTWISGQTSREAGTESHGSFGDRDSRVAVSDIVKVARKEVGFFDDKSKNQMNGKVDLKFEDTVELLIVSRGCPQPLSREPVDVLVSHRGIHDYSLSNRLEKETL